LWALLGRGEPDWWRAGVAGHPHRAAPSITRTIGFTLVVPMVGSTSCWPVGPGAARRDGGRIGVPGHGRAARRHAVVLLPYSAYFYSQAGYWGLTGATGNVLYGRTASIAGLCSKLPPDDAGTPAVLSRRTACPSGQGIDYYTHFVYGNPDWPPEGFARRANQGGAGQPVRQAKWSAEPAVRLLRVDPRRTSLKNFDSLKRTHPNDVPVERWHFQLTYPYYDIGPESTARDGTTR
jgi:hypothetical protein